VLSPTTAEPKTIRTTSVVLRTALAVSGLRTVSDSASPMTQTTRLDLPVDASITIERLKDTRFLLLDDEPGADAEPQDMTSCRRRSGRATTRAATTATVRTRSRGERRTSATLYYV